MKQKLSFKFKVYSILILFLNFVFANPLIAAEYFVSPVGSPTDNCSPTTPCNLQTALTKAATDNEDSTIILKGGNYLFNQTQVYNATDDGSLYIKAENPNQPPILTINSTDSDAVLGVLFILDNGTSPKNIVIENLKFEKSANFFLGIVNILNMLNNETFVPINANVKIMNCEFKNNLVGIGAPVLVYSHTIHVKNNNFKNNLTFVGGSAINFNGNDIKINRNKFIGNRSFLGAPVSSGIIELLLSDQPVNADNILITNNIFAYNNKEVFTLTFDNETISPTDFENSTLSGAIIIFSNSTQVNIVNNTFWENSGNFTGGILIETENSTINVYNNLFYNNSSNNTIGGYGADIIAECTNNSTLNVYNNNFSCNSTFNGKDCVAYLNCTLNHGNNLSVDPMISNPENYDFHILPNSPMRNKGENSIVRTLSIVEDFEGDPRIAEGIVDIGADELKLAQVPTLNQWGIVILAFTLIMLGLLRQREKSKDAAEK